MGMTNHKEGRTRPAASQDWASASAPTGYDQLEFDPKQAPRDFERKPSRAADDERTRLRAADAAMEGDQHAADPSANSVSEKWDLDDDDSPIDTSRRLYKD